MWCGLRGKSAEVLGNARYFLSFRCNHEERLPTVRSPSEDKLWVGSSHYLGLFGHFNPFTVGILKGIRKGILNTLTVFVS